MKKQTVERYTKACELIKECVNDTNMLTRKISTICKEAKVSNSLQTVLVKRGAIAKDPDLKRYILTLKGEEILNNPQQLVLDVNDYVNNLAKSRGRNKIKKTTSTKKQKTSFFQTLRNWFSTTTKQRFFIVLYIFKHKEENTCKIGRSEIVIQTNGEFASRKEIRKHVIDKHSYPVQNIELLQILETNERDARSF